MPHFDAFLARYESVQVITNLDWPHFVTGLLQDVSVMFYEYFAFCNSESKDRISQVHAEIAISEVQAPKDNRFDPLNPLDELRKGHILVKVFICKVIDLAINDY